MAAISSSSSVIAHDGITPQQRLVTPEIFSGPQDWQGAGGDHAALPAIPQAPAGSGDGRFAFGIERSGGLERRALGRSMAAHRPHRSALRIGYELMDGRTTALWLAGTLGAERRRVVLEGLRGKSSTTREASVGAGWVYEGHWELSGRYLLDDSQSRRTGLRRGLELAAGAPQSATAIVGAVTYSPALERAEALRLGLALKEAWLSSGDARAYTVREHAQTSLTLTLATAF